MTLTKPQIHGLCERKITVAWNLAGGYQKPFAKVIAIHENTIGACIAAWDVDG